jgi:predicted aconitase
VGVTPEAPTRAAALGGRTPRETVRLGPEAFVRALKDLSGAADGPLDLVALGTPHFSPTEFQALHRLLGGRRVKEGLPVIVSTSRFVKDFIAGQGILDDLETSGVRVIADTCTYFTPAIREAKGRVMTNAAKWAYYAPGMLPVEVAFGSLAECVESAIAGEVRRDPSLWAGFGGSAP